MKAIYLGCLKTLIALVACPLLADEIQKQDLITIKTAGCNATAFTQVPGSSELFIGRQMLTADGQLAGVSGPDDCSGGDPANQKSGKIFNRWGLVLNRFDWAQNTFSIVKPLLDTSIDATTMRSRAVITGGSMRGAIIRSAYDADIVRYRGKYLVVFECTIDNPVEYNVQGTSSCLSVYDPNSQDLDLGHTQVLISGVQQTKDLFVAAAVPELLVFDGRLFVYWSALEVLKGNVSRISVRGAELLSKNGSFHVKDNKSAITHSTDVPGTKEIWGVDPKDALSDTTVDLRAVWNVHHSIIMAASLGGSGCVSPSGSSRGCFRLGLVKITSPLGKHVTGQVNKLVFTNIPSNAQEYTRPIRDVNGTYWLIGHFIKPIVDGVSDAAPVPDADFWLHNDVASTMVLMPIVDRSVWPTN